MLLHEPLAFSTVSFIQVQDVLTILTIIHYTISNYIMYCCSTCMTHDLHLQTEEARTDQGKMSLEGSGGGNSSPEDRTSTNLRALFVFPVSEDRERVNEVGERRGLGPA